MWDLYLFDDALTLLYGSRRRLKTAPTLVLEHNMDMRLAPLTNS